MLPHRHITYFVYKIKSDTNFGFCLKISQHQTIVNAFCLRHNSITHPLSVFLFYRSAQSKTHTSPDGDSNDKLIDEEIPQEGNVSVSLSGIQKTLFSNVL